MEKSRAIFAMLLLTVGLFATALAQRSKSCDVTRLADNPEAVNVYCDCMQRLTQVSLKINELTINQTECSETGLELMWSELESRVAPEKLTLLGAEIYIAQNASLDSWNPSIRELSFIDCNIKELPEYAFQGMSLLKEVRLIRSNIEIIKSDAFSNLGELQVIEFSNSTITEIEDHAFNNLPDLQDLAFGYCSIGNFESGAITLRASQDAARERCRIGRSMDGAKEIIDNIMGRELSSLSNVSLPEYGTRLTLYKNNIFTINSRAIATETLGFLILGGNHILMVEQEAFDMELYNECEISAALIVGNTIDTLSSLALKGLRGKDGASYQAFLALANNTFTNVFDQAFQLSDNLVIFAVEENQFGCNCDILGWVLNRPSAQIQRELEKEIVDKAVCLDGTNLISFTASCTDHGNPIVTTPDSPQTTSSVPSEVTTELPSSASALSYTASLAAIMITTFLL